MAGAGLKNIEITIVDTYNTDFLKGFAAEKGSKFNLPDADMEKIDGAFASAYVKALK